ncbi:MAG: multicopper oxidase domain-containing protein [Pseudomonadota bacterium]|nr:multicopper oxidase domain-containing protein [Pseudomonadota bacterium]
MSLRNIGLLVVAALVFATIAFFSAPAKWVPHSWRVTAYEWFGASDYSQSPATGEYPLPDPEIICPTDARGWRKAQVIEGVEIEASDGCKPDNPYLVAAAVKGTNQVSAGTLLSAGLLPDTVTKGRDLDGDGDPDEIHIKLEVLELNGNSPDLPVPVTTFSIAPGIEPGFWIFAPKSFGMSTANFETRQANDLLRMPAPVLRVEQGDKVTVTLENTHYLPHTIHFHGVDHPFSADHGIPHDETMSHLHGVGTDGVAETSEMPAMPGNALVYEFQPRQAGTMFYHCHVQANVHILMGMQGMFVIEENRPNNWVQSINVGAGHVRHRSVAVRETHDREYDLHFQDFFKELGETIQKHTDPRLTIHEQHRRWDITDDDADYYLLNGVSFPYTLQDSLVIVEPDTKVKMRVLNGGSEGVAFHSHGFRPLVTHLDGIPLSPGNQFQRDVIWIASAQRVDLTLQTTNDGLNNYGEGIWIFHDHREAAQTTDGIYPGGTISAITFESYLDDNGFPKVHGVDWKKFFTPEYYRKSVPIWLDYDIRGLFGNADVPSGAVVRFVVFGVAIGGLIGILVGLLTGRRRDR